MQMCPHLKAAMQKKSSVSLRYLQILTVHRNVSGKIMTFMWLTDDISFLIHGSQCHTVPASLTAANMLMMPWSTAGFLSKCASLEAPVGLLTVFKIGLFIEEQALEISFTFNWKKYSWKIFCLKHLSSALPPLLSLLFPLLYFYLLSAFPSFCFTGTAVKLISPTDRLY